MIEKYVNSVEKAIDENNWYAALSLAVALPDICGGVDLPEEKSSKNRYVKWYDGNVLPIFKNVFSAGEGSLLLSGADCYALRCAFLHNGSEEISSQRAQEFLETFYFVEPKKGWSFNTRTKNTMLIIQVDRFCKLICDSVLNWLKNTQITNNKKTLFLKIYDPKVDGLPL